MATSPYQQYFATQVQTATPAQLVIMLYDGAVRFMRLGQRALEAEDREEANRVIGRAAAIVQELMATLNPDAGEVAGHLWALYEFSLSRLLQTQLKGDATLLDAPIHVFLTLREGWEQITLKAGAPRAAAAVSGVLVAEA